MDSEQVDTDGICMTLIYIDICENGKLDDFITFAKQYNIFLDINTKIYKRICNKIKERLDREGLSYEIVRPE